MYQPGKTHAEQLPALRARNEAWKAEHLPRLRAETERRREERARVTALVRDGVSRLDLSADDIAAIERVTGLVLHLERGL
ncbi:hypothetical protein IC614_02910 [Allosphingosinicella flava]|uniref:Uncharacterized protein n=1 Tax=Allosphingosinicella flava TaxID=2771430 RepID=A0A7T2LMS1_9SPHN|nr:hypothetical protein [Sphingosinicella flava]QPQ55568.1 hypothetical protein IC614_02910 [Sphingosinicella flava]